MGSSSGSPSHLDEAKAEISAQVREEGASMRANGDILTASVESNAIRTWLLGLDEHLLVYLEGFEHLGLRSASQVYARYARQGGELDSSLLEELGVRKLGHRRLLQRWCRNFAASELPWVKK